MHARVAVASNALDLGSIHPLAATALHEGLIQTLLAHGRLVFASNDEARDFVRAVKSTADMPPGARARWETLVVHLRNSHRIAVADPTSHDTLATVDVIERLRAGWGTRADVAVVAHSVSNALGVPEESGILSAPGVNPDVVIAVAAASAPALVRIIEQEQNPVASHLSERETFWTDVLEPIATGATEATIVDGYLFNRVSDLAHGRGRPSRVPEHIVWLLDHLDGVMAGRSTVRLIGNAAKLATGDDAQAVAQTIRDRWSPLRVGRLSRVEVHLSGQAGGRRFPHDRHIRFSTGGAIKITAGFDRLSEDRIWDASGMWWNFLWQNRALDVLRDDERLALSMARHREAVVLNR